MKIIGLTGGIGSGKSTVSAYLLEKGFPVADADRIARETAAPGSRTLEQVRTLLGEQVIGPDGALDRKKTAEIVFRDREILSRFNEIMHRAIRTETQRQLKEAERRGFRTAFLDAPLLIEAGFDDMTHSVWLVTAPEEVRIRRLMERDGASREAILDRMRHQMSDREKMLLADECLDNSKGVEELLRQTETLLEKYGIKP